MAQNLWQDFQTGLFSKSIFSTCSLPSSSSMRPELRELVEKPTKTASKNGQDSRQNQGKGVPGRRSSLGVEHLDCSTG